MYVAIYVVPSLSSASSPHARSFFSMAASVSTANSRSGEGVVICVSKAIDESDKSLLYVSKLEDEQIGEGDPVQLIDPRSGMNLWSNIDLWRKHLSFGEIVKFRIVENKYVYDGKAGKKKMVSYLGRDCCRLHNDIDLGPVYMISVTRDSPPQETTLPSVYMRIA